MEWFISKKQVFISLILIVVFADCKNTDAKDLYPIVYPQGMQEITVRAGSKTTRKIRITLYTPTIVQGNLLVLPGWKFKRKRWLNETNLVKVAENNHLRLICPEMNTSLYASKYYPQTRLKWGPTPGLYWITHFLLPEMQKQKILKLDQDNFLLGLSTGARGVALLALDNPKLWRAASALSGDYNQTAMPKDNLMTAVYGSYNKFSKRWQTTDNPQSMVSKWKIPLYLAHGSKDRIVPLSQSQNFYRALKQVNPKLKILYKTPQSGHDFKFWGSQVLPSILFFRQYSHHNQINSDT